MYETQRKVEGYSTFNAVLTLVPQGPDNRAGSIRIVSLTFHIRALFQRVIKQTRFTTHKKT
jgi:hypothetical protein